MPDWRYHADDDPELAQSRDLPMKRIILSPEALTRLHLAMPPTPQLLRTSV